MNEEVIQRPIPRVVGTIATVLWAGCFGISAYLYYKVATGGAILGCSEGNKGCGSVLASKWSNVLGVSVTLPAMAVYALAIMCVWVSATKPDSAVGRGAGRLLMLLIGAMVASAVWFTYAQIGLVKEICGYCTTAHVLGIVGAGITYFGGVAWRVDGVRTGMFPGSFKPATWVVVGMVWALLLPGLAREKAVGVTSLGKGFAGSAGTGFDVDTGTGDSRTISILQGRLFLKPSQFPVLGRRDAKVIVVEMFDYTCPHCRNMARVLEKARDRYAGELAVLPLYTSLGHQCNPNASYNVMHGDSCELGKMGIAIARIDKAKWLEYDAFVMKGETAPPVAEVKAFAESLVGKAKLEEEVAKPSVDAMVQSNLAIYRQIRTLVGQASLPILIYKGEMIIGYPGKEEDLYKLLESSYGLKPVAAATRPATRPAGTQPGG